MFILRTAFLIIFVRALFARDVGASFEQSLKDAGKVFFAAVILLQAAWATPFTFIQLWLMQLMPVSPGLVGWVTVLVMTINFVGIGSVVYFLTKKVPHKDIDEILVDGLAAPVLVFFLTAVAAQAGSGLAETAMLALLAVIPGVGVGAMLGLGRPHMRMAAA